MKWFLPCKIFRNNSNVVQAIFQEKRERGKNSSYLIRGANSSLCSNSTPLFFPWCDPESGGAIDQIFGGDEPVKLSIPVPISDPKWFMPSVRLTSYGCSWEVGRA